MTRTMLGWRQFVRELWQWCVGSTSYPPMVTPSAAVSEDRTVRAQRPIVFTPVSPVPTPPRLAVELVPQTCWFSNVRDHVSQQQWDQLRRHTYRQARYRCEICGGRGPQWPVECHELWHYDDTRSVQTLVRLIALCPACHRAKHIGLAEINGHLAETRAHLARVNAWTEGETDAYLAHVWQVWERRSGHPWRLDFTWLEQRGVVVLPKR